MNRGTPQPRLARSCVCIALATLAACSSSGGSKASDFGRMKLSQTRLKSAGSFTVMFEHSDRADASLGWSVGLLLRQDGKDAAVLVVRDNPATADLPASVTV